MENDRSDGLPEIKPWRVTESRSVLRDRWIDVRADTCLTPAGATIAPYYVLQPSDWVHVLAIDSAQQAIMVRQYRHGLGQASLEAPGGVMDATDASPAAAAERELLEETGYGCGALIPVGRFSPNPANHTNMVHVFAARDARHMQPPQREAGETMRTECVPLSQLHRMACGGGLVHGLHIAVVLMCLDVLGRE